MGAFGFRTRYDRILIESNRTKVRDPIRERLAEPVLRRWRERGLEQEKGELAEIRLIRSLWSVGHDALANPTEDNAFLTNVSSRRWPQNQDCIEWTFTINVEGTIRQDVSHEAEVELVIPVWGTSISIGAGATTARLKYFGGINESYTIYVYSPECEPEGCCE